MKVKELIEELKKLDQEKEVVYLAPNDNDVMYYQEVMYVEEYDDKVVVNRNF